ncbi:MAG: ABC transporter substrate-binding protein, partial [Chloroflexota bacterium]
WHDGTPVTPEDVKFNIEYRMENDPQSGWMKDVLESIDLDGDTVTIKLNKPYGTLLVEFNTYVVLPKHIWEKVNDPLNYSGEDAAIGCGPYILEKFDPGAGLLSFKANPEYHSGKPSVDRLEFRIYKNVDSMTMALSKGDVDVIWDYSASIPYTSAEALSKVPEITLATEVDMGVPVAMGFNMAKYPTNELTFREAISYAINYPQIAEFIFAGHGKVPTAAFVPPSMPLHDEKLRPMQFDPNRAASLLESIGLKDADGDGLRETPQGEKVRLTLLTRTDSAAISRSGELIQGYLRAVGIDASLKALDSATWVALKDKMDYDLVLYRTTPWGMLMHAGYGSGYFDARRTGAGVLHNVEDKSYLDLCDEMLQTTDPALYRELALRLQQYYADQLPSLAIAWGENVYPHRGPWQGWEMNQISGGLVNRESFFSLR